MALPEPVLVFRLPGVPKAPADDELELLLEELDELLLEELDELSLLELKLLAELTLLKLELLLTELLADEPGVITLEALLDEGLGAITLDDWLLTDEWELAAELAPGVLLAALLATLELGRLELDKLALLADELTLFADERSLATDELAGGVGPGVLPPLSLPPPQAPSVSSRLAVRSIGCRIKFTLPPLRALYFCTD